MREFGLIPAMPSRKQSQQKPFLLKLSQLDRTHSTKLKGKQPPRASVHCEARDGGEAGGGFANLKARGVASPPVTWSQQQRSTLVSWCLGLRYTNLTQERLLAQKAGGIHTSFVSHQEHTEHIKLCSQPTV